MKTTVLLLLLPALAFGQTIHIKDKKIVYEGKENLGKPMPAVNMAELESILNISTEVPASEQQGEGVTLYGKMKLQAPYYMKRYVNYCLKLTPLDSGYKYVIDSVYFTQQERGRKVDTVPSQKMVEKIDETGAIVGETERILNETDMRFQKLIAVLRSKMKKA